MKKKLKIAIADFPPLIINEDGKYKGFEIDLWEAIAKIAGIDFDYEKHTFQEIIPLLSESKVNVGLAGITIKEGREKIIDFSHPTLNSGLLISVNKNRNKLNFFKTAKNILIEGRKSLTSVILGLLIFIFVLGNILWLAEQSAGTFNKSYFPGIFEAFWLTVVSMTTVGYGDFFAHTWLGRIVSTIIIFGGAIGFGLLVAQFSAFLTVKKIKGQINNSRDLHGKVVATVEGSTSVVILKKLGAKVLGFLNIEDAYVKLESGEVDAVVFDAPVSIYFQQNDKNDYIEIVGDLFDRQQYGIAMQQGSKFREKINQTIFNLQESGQYDLIYKKWFGDDSVMEI